MTIWFWNVLLKIIQMNKNFENLQIMKIDIEYCFLEKLVYPNMYCIYFIVFPVARVAPLSFFAQPRYLRFYPKNIIDMQNGELLYTWVEIKHLKGCEMKYLAIRTRRFLVYRAVNPLSPLARSVGCMLLYLPLSAIDPIENNIRIPRLYNYTSFVMFFYFQCVTRVSGALQRQTHSLIEELLFYY